MESNDSPEIPDRGEASGTPGLPLGVEEERKAINQQLNKLKAVVAESG